MQTQLSGGQEPTKYTGRAKDARPSTRIASRWREAYSPAESSMPSTLMKWLFLVLPLSAFNTQGQSIYFDRTYDSNLSEHQNEGIWGSNLFEFDNGYLFASFTKDNITDVSGLWLVRTDLFGDTLWTLKDIDSQYAEFPQNMVAIADGRYAFVSTVSDLVGLTPADIALTVIDSFGSREWKVLYGSDMLVEVASQIIATSDNGFALVGQRTIDVQTDADIYLVRADSGGNFLWEQQYGGNDFDGGYSLVQTSDGGFLLLGWTRSFGAGQRDWYLLKTDSLGNQEWQKTYGDGNSQTGWNLIALEDGNYLMSGGAGNSSARMIKTDPDGNVIWQKNYSHPESTDGSNFLFKPIELEDGRIAACGLTNNTTDGDAGWLIVTDASGNLQWQRKYNYNSNTDLFYTLIATSDGGFLLGGQAKHDFPLTQDAWLLKVDSVGCTYADCLVGVDELNSSKIVADVWPNPANQFINIGWEQQGSAEITLLDITGKEVLRQQSNNQREVVDVSGLPSGLYVLQLVQGEVLSSLRVVVQH